MRPRVLLLWASAFAVLLLVATPVAVSNAGSLDLEVGASFTYKYFPETEVYFDTERGMWFYMKGADWQASVSLPGDVEVDRDDYVTIKEDTDRPYLKHKEHKKKYPPGLAKKGWKRGKKSWKHKKR